MSQRAKRPNRSEDGSVPVKRRKRTAVEEEEAATLAASWQSRPGNDNRIYNRTTTEAPAELFRKDLISAMKLPDSEPLSADEYWIITDQWKQEWERGVQVPVNPDSLPEPSVTIHLNHKKSSHEFKLPKNKYIRITKDDNFKLEEHVLSNAPTQSEDACSYDLDECDVAWLRIVNSERVSCGLSSIHEDQLERVMERFELCCWDKIQTILRDEEGLGIEFDENVICDVCRSPDSEEGNEMVFCDSCNICVHQACYGITRIPEGQWLCCTCHLGKRPKCVLCPNKGGAMKSTRSGQKWAHVSCALWIPEVSIGCVEKMEPITKISSIPQSRWALICVLCRERVGACIQCSVKTCKTAYHVTCAFKHGLEMRAIIEDENADDGVKLRSYCEKHSKSSKKDKSICSGSEDDDSKRRKRKDMTSEEKNQARAARLQEIEAEFYKHVSVKDVSHNLNVDQDALLHIYSYWKLKRRAAHNKPLLPPKTEDIDMLSHKREQADKEKLKMFVQLRQDLERVRNLCYMVSRREKLSRSFFKLREQTFFKQTTVLEAGINLPTAVINAVIEANHGPSIYDQLYSHEKSEDHTSDFELIMARIAGIKSPNLSGDEKKPEINGLFKDVKNNPYKKVYLNGSKRRSRSFYSSMSSGTSSSDEKPKDDKENRLVHPITSDEEKPIPFLSNKNKPKKQINKKITERRKRMSDRIKAESSSEEDEKPPIKKEWTTSFTRSKLSQVEHELGLSGTDSDDLMDIRNSRSKSDNHPKMSSIYSDTESSDSTKNEDKSNNSDSQQRIRTKASVKEFIHKPSTSKTSSKITSPESKKKTKPEDKKENNTNSKKKDYVPSDLIVPQRQAAKKATENLKSTTTARTKDVPLDEPAKIERVEEKPKTARHKPKSKETTNSTASTTTPKESPKEKQDVSEVDKDDKLENPELLAYVPQRQAAKKAAEHIKSGLGKSIPITDTTTTLTDTDKTKKDHEVKIKKDSTDSKFKKEQQEQSAAKIPETKRKSSSNSSSSSSSSSSSGSSSTSSSSSSDDEPEPRKSRSESSFSIQDQTKRANAKDRPFLDKGTKSATSSSSTSDSGCSTPQKPQSQLETANSSTKSPRKSFEHTTSEREEPKSKGKSPRRRTCSSNVSEIGNSSIRHGDLSDSKRIVVERDRTKTRKRKQSTSDKLESNENTKTPTTTTTTTEKINKSSDILSPIRQKDKKLNQNIPDEKLTTSTLEKEILERKASKENKTKSTLDRLFGPIGNLDKEKHHDKNSKRSPRKEVSTKKSPSKSHKIANLLSPKQTNEDVTESNDNNLWKKPDELKPNKFISELFKSDKENAKNSSPKNLNRSIFSPQPNKESDFDSFEDNFGISKEDEVLKPFTFNTSIVVNKKDTKEDNVRETLNLVEKLRMGLSKKPTATGCEAEETLSTGSSKIDDRSEFLEQVVPNNPTAEDYPTPVQVDNPMVNLQMRIEIDKKNFDGDHQNYPFINCQDVPLECNKNVPIEQHQGLSGGNLPAQGDERWVPPSEQPPPPYPNFANNHHFNSEQFTTEHHKKYPEISNMFAEVGARLQEEVLKNNQHGRRLIDSIPEIIPEIHMQPPKWAENVLMPNRRSSTSSAASSLSSTSRRNDHEDDPNKLRTDMMLVNPPNIDISLFPPQNIPNFQPNLESFGGFPEASNFVNPVSLFAGPNLNTQLAFPSAGPAGFPPAFGAPFPTPHSAVPPIPKPEENLQFPSTCTAAFTSSQHNMALTAAMVNLPTSKDIPIVCPNSVPIDSSGETNQKETVPPPQESPIVSSAATSVASSPSQKSTPGKKSPSKPTRCSARVSSQLTNKSPSKSPGKSPRQDVVKPEKTKKESKKVKSSGKGAHNQKSRGRGRGRGRQASTPHHTEYDIMGNTNTIQKLVGTVYDLDFDDEWNDTADLKSMRERRKSTDIHDKKDTNSINTPSESPKFSSPSQNSYKNRSYNVDLSNLRPPTPIEDSKDDEVATATVTDEEQTSSSTTNKSVFPDIVPPFLPGPVDMRTYNSNYEEQKYESSNLLQAFAAGTTENQVHEDIDEEYEKELHAALMGKQKNEQALSVPEISNIKVSLSDSRNQLKVKIKGPIANYTSSVAPLPTPTVTPIVVTNISSNSATINVSNNSSNASGTSNLRRMRKKELLRQYWSQDMSMDDPSSGPANSTPIAPPMNRTTITIPKAVTSVTSIPTKDDYRDYRTFADDYLESKQHRKETKSRSALSRELRHLDLSLDGSSSNNSSLNESKRRGRPPRTTTNEVLTTPKLKIKIGNNSIISASRVDDKRDKIRPPKKRLANISMPSVEDLKRESMKFRKMVMAGFDEKRRKKDKSEKRKKKKKQQVEIVPNECENSTRLIIRFNKKPEEDVKRTTTVDNLVNNENVSSETTTPSEVKLTPIKLKLSRCQEGSGYVMKPASNSQTTNEDKVTQPGQPPPETPPPEIKDTIQPPPAPLPLNKDCEVR